MLSQWNRFAMYDIALDGRRPLLVVPPFTESSLADGLGYFLPDERGEGIVVALALFEETWEMFDRLDALP